MSTSLLAVLTPYEAEHFFPEPLLADLRALFPDFRQLDPTDLSPAAFAEKLARIKRRAVPDECFRDKGLMSKWIDGNK